MIPAKTQLLDLSVEDGICTVILSDDFAENDDSAQHAALAVRSITATLCALEGFDAVTIQNSDVKRIWSSAHFYRRTASR